MDIGEVNLLMVGLDKAGKSKLLFTLIYGSIDKIIPPTIGYNVESLEHNGTTYTLWEVGGLKKMRPIRKSYTEDKAAVIYVVDAADGERFEEAQKDLHDLMEMSDLKDVPLLVVSNKMDLVPEFDVESLAEYLNLPGLKQKWNIYGVSAVEGGDRLFKILDILNSMLNQTEGDEKEKKCSLS